MKKNIMPKAPAKDYGIVRQSPKLVDFRTPIIAFSAALAFTGVGFFALNFGGWVILVTVLLSIFSLIYVCAVNDQKTMEARNKARQEYVKWSLDFSNYLEKRYGFKILGKNIRENIGERDRFEVMLNNEIFTVEHRGMGLTKSAWSDSSAFYWLYAPVYDNSKPKQIKVFRIVDEKVSDRRILLDPVPKKQIASKS